MALNILSVITGLFKPVNDIVGTITDGNTKKLELANQLAKMQSDVTMQVLDLQAQLVESQSKNIQTEMTGASWLQRNWRPITMLTFLALVVLDSFGFLANPLNDGAWALLQIGLGGYVVGRSAEKIIPKMGALKK